MSMPPPESADPACPAWAVTVRPPLARWPTPPLRAVLDEHGVTTADLAERLGLTVATMRRLLAGGDRLSTDQAERICAAIGTVPAAVWANWTELLDMRVWEPMPWTAQARCRGSGDTALFFAPAGETADARWAREQFAITEYCDHCTVIDDCRSYARRNREHGVWGGEGEDDRARAGYPPRSSGFRLHVEHSGVT